MYACKRSWDHAREFVYRKFAEKTRRQTPRQRVQRVVDDVEYVSPDDDDDVGGVDRRTFWTHVMDTLDVPYDDIDDDGIDDIDASTFIEDEAYPFASRARAVR